MKNKKTKLSKEFLGYLSGGYDKIINIGGHEGVHWKTHQSDRQRGYHDKIWPKLNKKYAKVS